MKKRLLIALALISVHIASFASEQSINIIPRPQQVEMIDGTFLIDRGTTIVAPTESRNVALLLQAHIKSVLGQKLSISQHKNADNSIRFVRDSKLSEEGYQLNITESGIQVMAATDTGWFYAVQSLKQLIYLNPGEQAVQHFSIPAMTIKDSPRFAWRAFMLDEARYFKGTETVKMLLDEMARLKMNVFHWHLVDDQGWRIEIKKYPLLTEIGSIRKSTQIGALKWDSPVQSGEVHQGYYTQAQIKEIVRYASDRHITVVPEIEMPGHSSAAIAAYSWLGTNKKAIEVPIKFGVGQDVYDVGNPKVLKFLTDVLDEVMMLFPSKVIHIGGDEVKYEHWKNSPSIQDFMLKKGLKSPAELQVYFTNTISQYLQSKGRRMMGWNEILGHKLHEYQDEEDTHSDQTLAKGTVVHFWKGDLELATKAIKDGFDIVNSIHTETYLDYDYKSIPLSKAYAFDPIPAGLASQYHSKVIGSGSQMWSEWIPTKGEMHYMVFPRIAAYAEVDWTNPSAKDFTQFSRALDNLKMIWKEKGIYFAEDVEPQ
jgi:hexosaminidase